MDPAILLFATIILIQGCIIVALCQTRQKPAPALRLHRNLRKVLSEEEELMNERQKIKKDEERKKAEALLADTRAMAVRWEPYVKSAWNNWWNKM